tara:strand:+ start:106 stop:489 length:384 start_codon:yes stop_codon:yes gene_type:complete
MKTYKQFVAESYSARENIQEALPALLAAPALVKAAKLALGAYQGYQAYKAAKKAMRGDYKGAALDAAAAIPVGGKAYNAARALGATKNISRGASALTSGAKWTAHGRLDDANTKDIRTLDPSKYQRK